MTTITFHPYAPGITGSEGNRLGSIDPRLSRTNYFDGQLLKASDLTRDQIYLDERLLELGQVLGSGIAQGLEVELVQNHLLQVKPGIAVAPSGRVLQLSGKTLEINLQDSGFIASLNKGLYRRFNRGLYAVALCYAEVVDGVSEAYPADLTSRREMQVSRYAEGVELALIPLNIALPHGDEISIRAALAQQFIGQGGHFSLPTDEAVPLGLIAIDNACPQWLDLGLVRRPLRRPNLSNALQLDLAAHYRELFADVLAARQTGGLQNNFAASSYFRLLPPFGPLPKGSIDPINGRQSYFPKDYEVAIAPVRRADLPSIIEESAHLAPMDMERDADADIMVLVPMSDQAFALRARQLEKPAQEQVPNKKLSLSNGLALRLFTQPPAHLIDTDTDAWKMIWAEAEPNELVYVRRPPRTAETNVSAVVLARGFDLPQKGPGADIINEQFKKLEAENKALNKKITELQASATATDAVSQQKFKELATALDEANSKASTLQGARDTAQSKLSEAETKLNTLKAEIEQLKKKQAELGSSATTGTANPASINKENERLQQQIKEHIDRYQTLEASLGQTRQELQQKINLAVSLQAERNNIQLKLTDAETRLKTPNMELEQLKQKLSALNSSAATGAADLASARKENEKLQLQINEYANRHQTLEASLGQTRQELQQKINLAASLQAERNDFQLKLTEANKAKTAAEIDTKSVQQKLSSITSETNSLIQELKQRTDLPVTLQTRLSGMEKTISVLGKGVLINKLPGGIS
ncbi:MAG: methyltransferase type 11 [Rhodocyclales bacterium]|nr:methyltransferase type 11 [Rhodocyclales bacterium]